MSVPQVIDGTSEEIVTLLRGDAFAGRRMRVVVELEDEEVMLVTTRIPPNSIRDARHLEELLLQGLASPAREMTTDDWDELHRRVRRRSQGKAS